MGQSVERLKPNLVYEGEATADELQQDLARLRELDKTSESRKRVGCFVMVVGLLTAIGGVVSTAEQPTMSTASMIVIVVGLVILVGGIVGRVTSGRGDLPDVRYELLHRLLELLRRDMAANAPLQVQLDFSSPAASKKFTKKGSVGSWDVKYYDDPWLRLQGRFVDGTSYMLQLTERTQKRSKWKTSSSGKSKHKTKTKSATVAALSLKVKPRKYPQLGLQRSRAKSLVTLPAWCEVKRLQVEDAGMLLKVGTKGAWDVAKPDKPLDKTKNDGVEMIAAMFMGLYSVLDQSRPVK